MRIRYACLALGTVACALVWLVFHAEVRRSGYEAELFVKEQLEQIHVGAIRLRESVLAVDRGYETHYDGIVSAETAIREATGRMNDAIATREDQIDPVIIEQLLDLQTNIADLYEAADRFKRSRSILANSIGYLPRVAEESRVALATAGESELALTSQRLAITALGSAFDPDSLDRLVAKLGSSSTVGLAEPERFLDHVRIVARERNQIAELIAEIRDHESSRDVERLREVFATATEARMRRLANEQRLAYCLASVLVFALAGLVFALQRSRSALAAANCDLEGKIRDRSAQLVQAQKLEAVGQLAAGVAHEINTPAQYVSDNIQFLSDGFADLQPALEVLEKGWGGSSQAESSMADLASLVEAADVAFLVAEIPDALSQARQGIDRISEMVRAMRDFSSPGQDGDREIDLNRAVETTLAVARGEYHELRAATLDLASALPSVLCDPRELNQALLHLLVNAAHAIQDRFGPDAPDASVAIRTGSDGDLVWVEIEDNGCGVPIDTADRIFEPFFSTKEVGRGAGQGLAHAHATIVGRYGGSLDFESQVDCGSMFRIALPEAGTRDRPSQTTEGVGA